MTAVGLPPTHTTAGRPQACTRPQQTPVFGRVQGFLPCTVYLRADAVRQRLTRGLRIALTLSDTVRRLRSRAVKVHGMCPCSTAR